MHTGKLCIRHSLPHFMFNQFYKSEKKHLIHSILGVQSDCSQEQIRKHYKKIAVLVHPDKNKQPGAEEAFKILQRAFELIGEPVTNHFVVIFVQWKFYLPNNIF